MVILHIQDSIKTTRFNFLLKIYNKKNNQFSKFTSDIGKNRVEEEAKHIPTVFRHDDEDVIDVVRHISFF